MISRNPRQKTPELMFPLMKKLETHKMPMMPMEMTEQIMKSQTQESPKESKVPTISKRYNPTIPEK